MEKLSGVKMETCVLHQAKLLIILSLAAPMGNIERVLCSNWTLCHLTGPICSGLSPFIPSKINIVWSSMEQTLKVRNFRIFLAMKTQKAKNH